MYEIILTIAGFSVIFIATCLGSATVFFFKREISEKLNGIFLGFAGGIMISASVWSLLIPSIEQSTSMGKLNFLPAVVGFILGGGLLVLIDKLLPEHPQNDSINSVGRVNPIKLFTAITIHNIPEGLAVGFAFGGASILGDKSAYMVAFGLAIGIAIQNFPEGTAVSLPLKKITGSSVKSFLMGVFSGAVEPIFAILGYFLAYWLTFYQPWFLSFSAGAMIFVVAEDIIPNAKRENSHAGTWAIMLGFALMMALDVAL